MISVDLEQLARLPRKGIALGAGIAATMVYLLLGGMPSGLLLGAALVAFTLWAAAEPAPAAKQDEPQFAEAAPPATPPARVFGVLAEQIPGPRENLGQVRNILAEAGQELGKSFQQINAITKAQSEWLDRTLSEIHGSPELATISIYRLAADIRDNAALMGQLAGLIVQVSKRSLDVFDRVENAVARLREMERLVAGVKTLADQTTLLALNAAIEAAHVGAVGKGFEVVAQEIRQLANDSQKVSEEIRSQVTKACESAAGALALTQENAAQDLTVLLEARSRMERMAAGAIELEQRLHENLSSVQVSSAQMGQVNGAAIQSLQFEDIVRQILERTEQDLSNLETVLQSVGQSSPGSDLSALAEALLAEKAAMAAHKPLQADITAGEVELF